MTCRREWLSAAGVIAIGVACGGRPAETPLAVTCKLDRGGAAMPSQALVRSGWALHDRDKWSLKAPTLSCDISGPPRSRATIESPVGDVRIGRQGTDHFTISIDKLHPMQKELTLSSGQQRVTVPLELAPYFADVKGEPTASGTLLVTGTVYGATDVSIAGTKAPVVDSKFSVEVTPTTYLQEHLGPLDIPLEPTKSLSLLLTAGTPTATAYATVTSPAPPYVSTLRQALLTEGKALPQAAELRTDTADRPTLAVVTEPDGKRLLSTKPDIKLSEVELIARAHLARIVVEKCTYVAVETDIADLPAERVTYAFQVSLTAAKDGRPIGTGKVEGKVPPPCPDKFTTKANLDKKLFIGSIPSYTDLQNWLRAFVPRK